MSKTHEIDEDTLNGMAREINVLTEENKKLAPALRCAGYLRDIAIGKAPNWLEIVDTLRELDALRYRL